MARKPSTVQLLVDEMERLTKEANEVKRTGNLPGAKAQGADPEGFLQGVRYSMKRLKAILKAEGVEYAPDKETTARTGNRKPAAAAPAKATPRKAPATKVRTNAVNDNVVATSLNGESGEPVSNGAVITTPTAKRVRRLKPVTV